MSINVLTWVLFNSETTLGTRLVLIALADNAHDDGSKAYPSVETLALKSRMSERAVQYSLRKLEEEGHIVKTGKSPLGTNVYRIIMWVQNLHPGANGDEKATKIAPEPSVNRQSSPVPDGTGKERVHAKLPKIGGKTVNGLAWRLTDAVLAEVNRVCGRNVSLITAGGKESEAARYIYKAIRNHPDLSYEDHQRIIAVTVQSRWWGTDKPNYAVIYSPKAFEKNIDRQPSDGPSRQTVRDARDAHKVEYEKLQEQRLAAFKRVAGLTPPDDPPSTTNGGNHDGRRVGNDQPRAQQRLPR